MVSGGLTLPTAAAQAGQGCMPLVLGCTFLKPACFAMALPHISFGEKKKRTFYHPICFVD